MQETREEISFEGEVIEKTGGTIKNGKSAGNPFFKLKVRTTEGVLEMSAFDMDLKDLKIGDRIAGRYYLRGKYKNLVAISYSSTTHEGTDTASLREQEPINLTPPTQPDMSKSDFIEAKLNEEVLIFEKCYEKSHALLKKKFPDQADYAIDAQTEIVVALYKKLTWSKEIMGS